jgi:hypothetical protein
MVHLDVSSFFIIEREIKTIFTQIKLQNKLL